MLKEWVDLMVEESIKQWPQLSAVEARREIQVLIKSFPEESSIYLAGLSTDVEMYFHQKLGPKITNQRFSRKEDAG